MNAKHSRAAKKRHRRLFLETLEPRVVLTAAPEVTIDGLVSWYRAEGNALDSADGNNGTLVSGATTAAGGQVGDAFSFSASNNRVQINDSASLRLQTFTIDAWVFPTYVNTGDTLGGEIIGKQLQADSNAVSVSILGPNINGKFTFALSLANGSQPAFTTANGFALGAWHHVAMTSNGASFFCYVDGVLQNVAGTTLESSSILYNPTANPPTPWTIGGHIGDPFGFANHFYGDGGKIDEVGIYQRQLSTAEVDAIYDRGNDLGLGRYAIPAGQQFTLPGAFADADADTWSGTVNYGDGPAQPLTLNPNKTFSLAHSYASVGQYTITASITDGTNTTPHSLVVNVTAPLPNTPPVGYDDNAWTVNEDQVLNVVAPAGVLVNDVDAELNPLTAVLVAGSGPSHGSLTLNANGSFAYTPVANYHGPDSFKYQASDGNLPLSNTATVNLTVTSVNDAPVMEPIGDQSVEEGTQLTFTAAATDVDLGDTLTFSLPLDAPAGAAISAAGVFTWTPTAEQGPGTYSLAVTVSDGSLSDVETITISVTEPFVNQPPVVTGLDLDQPIIDEDGTVVLNGEVTDANTLDTHTVTIDWGDGSAMQVVPVIPETRTFSVSHQYLDDNPSSTPSDDYLIQVSAEDNHEGTSSTESLTVTVDNVNPVVVPITGPSLGMQGQSLAFTGNYSDVGTADTQTASWQVIDGSSAVVASGSGTSFSFTPLAVDTYSVQFSVTDDDGGTTAVSKSVNVASVQMLPDPDRPGMTMLVIGGTAVSDTITLTPAVNAGEYSLNLNGLILGPYAPTGSVQIYGGGDNDTIVLNGNLSVNAFEVHVGCLVLNSLPFFDHDIENRQIDARGSGDMIAAYDGSVTIDGGSASDILVAAGPGSHAWLISSLNMGSLDGLVFFSHVEQLVGGSDADTFQFTGGGRISGSIQGGGGSDVLIAADSDNTWVIDSAHGGTVTNTSFSGIETLRGGSADDTFRIVQGVTFAGELDGAGGADKLNYMAYTSAVEVNLALGTATGVNGAIGIENTTGGNENDFLVGSAAANDISGGNGDDIILGLGGIDTLSGNAGSDLVVGGSGGDILHGNNMDDILVGGKLAYADESNSIDRDSLDAILSIWLTQVAYSTRTAALRGGLLNSSAVLEDNAIDELYGDGGVDWFLTGVGDIVKPGKGEDTN